MADSFDPSWIPPATPVEIPEEAVEAMVAQGPGGGVGSVVAVTSGGLTINLIFDAAAMAAPASFRNGIQQAAAILTSAISDHITVNLKIDYNGTGGGAAAGPDNGQWESYAWTRANLVNNASAGDTTFNALPTGTTIQGQSSIAVWNSQLKLWGVIGANDTTTDDGAATFATDINPNLLVGVALHELTHAFARVPYGPQPDVLDFYRYTSPGTRLFTGGATAAPAYFSLDGGNTKLADYGQTSDASDFLNSGVQGPYDPYDEFYSGSTLQTLTAVDLKQLDALGFHLMGSGTVIQTDGTTSLTLFGGNYYLNDTITGTGPELKYHGAPFTAGQFGTLVPIGAIQTGSGYDVAWQDSNSHLLAFWSTDGNGNYISNISGLISGNSLTSELLEAKFGQDFNHDGTTGITSSIVHTNGSTNLFEIADSYFMYVNGNGPQLKYQGIPFTVGEFGTLSPIAAIQVLGGYDVAWQDSSSHLLAFWTTDNNGNYVSNISGLVSGGSLASELMESAFGQDFNGDGVIGVPNSASTSRVVNSTNSPAATITATPASFNDSTLTLTASSNLNGQIVGFGNGSGDQIDLRGTNFSSLQPSFGGTSSGFAVSGGSAGAELRFLKNYTLDSFHFADDGHEVPLITIAAGPAQATAAASPASVAAIAFSMSALATQSALAEAIHNNAARNAVITDAVHDTITLEHVMKTELLAHLTDFHII